MPPKRIKGNKKAKKKRRKKKRAKEEEVPTIIYTKEKILQLQQRVVESYGQVYDLRVRTLCLRELAEVVNKETGTLQEDNIEYQEAMKARIEARGALVANARKQLSIEVAKAEKQRQEQVAAIEEKMKQLEMEKVEHESKLEWLRIMLLDMEPFGVQKQQQKELIKQLEEDLKNLKMHQEEELNIDKSNFVSVRRELEKRYNSDIATVTEAANKMIGPCLEIRLNEIRQSNARLNKQLYQITSRQKRLTGTKTKSSSERNVVVEDHQFWEGIDRPSRKTVCVRFTRKRSLGPLNYAFSAASSTSGSEQSYD